MKVEKDIFKFLPPSRRKNTYCREINHLDMNLNLQMTQEEYEIEISRIYNSIFSEVAAGPLGKSYNKSKNHRRGARCGYDHKTPRYWWLNFVPAITNTREESPDQNGEINSYTLEFRSHSSTLRYSKVKNWVKFVIGFVNYVDNFKTDILTKSFITMEDIVKAEYPKTKNSLLTYIAHRKRIFSAGTETSKEFETTEYIPENIAEIKDCSIKQLVKEENNS